MKARPPSQHNNLCMTRRVLVCLYLLFGNPQHLTRFQDIAFESVQLHDLGVSASFADVLLGDLPQRVAVFDRVRSAGGFGFRRDGFSGDGVVVLLHVRQERIPVRQDVRRTVFLRIEIFVGVDIRLGIRFKGIH